MKHSTLLPAIIVSVALLVSATIVYSGLRQIVINSAAENEARVKIAPATQADVANVSERNRDLLEADEPIQNGDILEVSVGDLTGPNSTSTRMCRVGHNGKIGLWYVGDIPASGLGAGSLEHEIASAYQSKQLISNALVVVTAHRPITNR